MIRNDYITCGEKICETCGNFHKSDNFDCEHWGDLPEDFEGKCHMWIEGDLPHNLRYRIKHLEELIIEMQKETKTGIYKKVPE